MDCRDDHLYRGRLACPYNQHEDAFGVVAQRAVPKIRRDRLRLVDYVDSHQQSLSATRGSTPIGEVSDGKCQCQTRRQCT
jgi:hypothetical protein